jgi:hypothetical protein
MCASKLARQLRECAISPDFAIGTIGQPGKSNTLYEIRSTKSEIGTVGRPRQSDRIRLRPRAALCSSVLSAAGVISPTV